MTMLQRNAKHSKDMWGTQVGVNWLIQRRGHKVGWVRKRLIWGSWGEGWIWSNTLYEILKELIKKRKKKIINAAPSKELRRQTQSCFSVAFGAAFCKLCLGPWAPSGQAVQFISGFYVSSSPPTPWVSSSNYAGPLGWEAKITSSEKQKY